MIHIILILLAVCALNAGIQRPPVKCSEDSPERRGKEGCTIQSSGRRALALVLNDAARPGSHDLTDPPALVPCT